MTWHSAQLVLLASGGRRVENVLERRDGSGVAYIGIDDEPAIPVWRAESDVWGEDGAKADDVVPHSATPFTCIPVKAEDLALAGRVLRVEASLCFEFTREHQAWNNSTATLDRQLLISLRQCRVEVEKQRPARGSTWRVTPVPAIAVTSEKLQWLAVAADRPFDEAARRLQKAVERTTEALALGKQIDRALGGPMVLRGAGWAWPRITDGEQLARAVSYSDSGHIRWVHVPIEQSHVAAFVRAANALGPWE